jgi:branched-chain amino acid transport system permease protein
MGLYPIPVARWTVVFFGVFFFVIVPLTFSDYLLTNLNLIGIAIVGALGLNILLGYTGQISIGHAAFMSVGAYTAANFAVHFNLPFWITLPMGGLMSAFIGIIVGFPSLRIKGLYLAIATLAAQFIIEWVINHVPAISGGFQASIEVPKPEIFGIVLDTQGKLYFFIFAVVVIAIVATLNLVRSRIGRAFIAIRDQDVAAEIIGISVFRYKLVAFAISSFYAGVAGVLYTYYYGVANYEAFQLVISIDYLAMVIIGGLGSVRHFRHHAADHHRCPAASDRAVHHRRCQHSFRRGIQVAPRFLWRPDHVLPRGGAGGPQPSMAEHTELLPCLALLLLS